MACVTLWYDRGEGCGDGKARCARAREMLMKLQNGLIDLHRCKLQWRNAVKTDASRLVSEEPLKDNESHHQETWPSQHMNPQAHQPVLHGSKPRAGGNFVSARKKKEDNMREEWNCRCFNSYSFALLSIMERKWMVTRQLLTQRGSRVQAEHYDVQVVRAHTRIVAFSCI